MAEKIGLGAGVPFGDALHSGSFTGLLDPGDYWASGDVSLSPTPGHYTSSSVLSDPPVGDNSTGETSTSDTITVVRVQSSPLAITSWAHTVYCRGNLIPAYFYWDGSAWQPMVNTGAIFAGTPVYTFFSLTAQFSGIPPSLAFRVVFQETNTLSGFPRVTDSRVG